MFSIMKSLCRLLLIFLILPSTMLACQPPVAGKGETLTEPVVEPDPPGPTTPSPEEREAARKEAAAGITQADLREHLRAFTSTEMAGRATGSPAQRVAAQYIASEFKAAGLTTIARKNGEDSYFQPFTLSGMAYSQFFLKIGGKRYKEGEDLFITGGRPTDKDGYIRLVLPAKEGDGRSKDYYADKWLVYTSAGPGGNPMNRVEEARALGAAGVVLFSNQAAFSGTESHQHSQHTNTRHRVYLSEDYKCLQGNKRPPLITLPATALSSRVRRRMDSESRGVLASFRYHHDYKETLIGSENVLGFLEGGAKKEEVIVITAHYDHLGVQGSSVFYGADDNGSGTAGLLEIAEAFGEAKKKGLTPVRSVLFFATGAEELGLLGSDYYTRHPLIPLANTVTNLNMDMIGRIDEIHDGTGDYVYLVGADRLSSELHVLSEAANKTYVRMTLDYRHNSPHDPLQLFYRSDQYSFAKHNIPVILYTSGLHADYHLPSDTDDKIVLNYYRRRIQLVFHTAFELAYRENRVALSASGFE